MAVGVLGQNAECFQGIAVRPCAAGFRSQFYRHHQAATANVLDDVGPDCPEAIEEAVAHNGGVLDHAFFRQHLQ